MNAPEPFVVAANGGVSWHPSDFDAQVSDELKSVNKLTEDIKAGTLKVESPNAPK